MAIILLFIAFPSSLFSQEVKSYGFADRWSLKTNAFEWLATIPNAGIEYDFFRNKHQKVSLSVTAKYNWNTVHSQAPSTVFDMSDIRPELRCYFRTNNRKISKPWWVMYAGPYVSYGTYTFKLSSKGIRGASNGAGISAGYVIPMYEYGKGAVDMELGLSLGVQACKKDVFVHDPERYCYTRIDEECTPRHMTPFPVLSEVRVAFVWRKESIRHQVIIDVEKAQRKQAYKKHKSLMIDDIEANLPLSLAVESNDYDILDKELMERSLYLKGENAIRNEIYGFRSWDIRMLERKVKTRCQEVRSAFRRMKKGGSHE